MSSISFYLPLTSSNSSKKQTTMANFYTDNPEIKYFLSHPLLKRIVELRERGYADADKYD